MNNIFKVVRQGKTFAEKSLFDKNRIVIKSNIVLEAMGGPCADRFVATMFGERAKQQFYCGELVLATINFSVYKVDDRMYQNAIVTDIVKIKE